jgi:hypothetical protein
LWYKQKNTMEKKKYIKPRIEWIPLDNEISLALASSPPEGPNETRFIPNEQVYFDPFKENVG